MRDRVEDRAAIKVFLIADIRGYTTYTHEFGDAAAARLASVFADLAEGAIEAWGGSLLEIRGDEALGTFGSPRAAVQAATDLQAAFAERSAEDDTLPLRVGIGLDVGPAVPVGEGFRGEALNVAARLCSAAGAGEVLATERIAELSRTVEGVRFEGNGALELKGLPGEVATVHVERTGGGALLPVPVTPAVLPAGLVPLVDPLPGRARDLSWLLWRWRSVRRGTGRVAAVLGPAGIGKTALLRAFAGRVADEAAVVRAIDPGVVPDVSEVTHTDWPVLLVVDGLDDLDARAAGAVVALARGLHGRPAMLLLAARRPSDPRAGEILDAIDVEHEHRRELGPLDAAAVVEVARLYVERTDGFPAAEIAGRSEGVPSRVHREVAVWARHEAAARLEVAADRTASGRAGLREAEERLAGDVIDLEAVEARARLHDPEGSRRRAGAADVCPYKGLATFDAADAGFFHGRERLVAEMLARLVGSPFLGVIGPSGSGKSSVVRAGLLPALAAGALPGSDGWRQVVLRPGEHPSSELTRALGVDPRAGVDPNTLVLVDQFEEVFTSCANDPDRRSFIASLVGLTRRDAAAPVIVAARADFYGRCADDPDLARLLGRTHVLVGPMDRHELHRAIVMPAMQVGLPMHPGLPDAMVDDVVGEPGMLPLLSTSLLELWRTRDGGGMDLDRYLARGGVRGAIARLAEEVYEAFPDPDRAVVRSTLLRLTGPGAGDSVVRRRASLDEFDGDEVATRVLYALADARLVTIDARAVEVAHEALLREWPRLQGWIDEDRQGRALAHHLAEASSAWRRSGDDGDLYRSARLAAALDWAAEHPSRLNAGEQAFLDASRSATQREAERQRRTNRRLRGALVGVAAFLVIALVAGGLALVQQRRASDAAVDATAQRLGAQALVEDQLDLSILLARQGWGLSDGDATRRNLLASLVRSPAVIDIARPIRGTLQWATLSPDGSLYAVANLEREGALVDTRTLEVVRRFEAGPIGWGSDGRLVMIPPGVVSILDPATGDVQELGDVRQEGGFPAFSPSLDRFAVVAAEGTELRVWRTGDARASVSVPAAAGRWFIDAKYTPDGASLVTIEGTEHEVEWVLRDPSTAQELRTFARTEAAPWSLGLGAEWAFAPDGRSIATGYEDGTVRVIDVASGTVRTLPTRQEGGVVGVTYSQDGKNLVSAGWDTRLLVWDVETMRLRETLEGHASAVWGPGISPDGRTLFSASLDGSVMVWDLEGSRRIGRPFTASDGNPLYEGTWPPVPELIAVSPMGDLLAFGQCDGQVVLRDARSLEEVGRVSFAPPVPRCQVAGLVSDVAFSGDGRTLVVGGASGRVAAFDTATGERRLELEGPPSSFTFDDPSDSEPLMTIDNVVEAVAVSPDGTTIAAGTDEGEVYRWDAASGRQVGPPIVVPDGNYEEPWNMVYDLAFSPDGTLLAASHGAVATVWSMPDAVERYSVNVDDGLGAAFAVAFSPDGATMATGGAVKDVRFWDAQTGTPTGSVVVTTTFVISVGFSPDGDTVITGGWDGAISLVDVGDRSVIGQLPGPENTFNSVAFDPSGETAFVSYETGEAIAWSFDIADWRDRACDVVNRPLTPDEWERFIPDTDYEPVCDGSAR